jgi:RNA polymerase sigma-70 factor (ECF subfamily)
MPLESDFDPPDGRILSDERSRLVARALARLPDEQREVIALHLNGQLKLREIARLQNVPLTTVRGRYRHGIDRLRSILNGRL